MKLKELLISFKRRCVPYFVAYLIKFVLSLVMRSCRIEIHGVNHLVETAQKHPCILALWHNRMVPLPAILLRYAKQFTYTAVISKSHDVDFLALFTTSYSCGRVLRVPYKVRHQALNEIIHRLKTTKEIMMITPDGPKGPFFVVKPGVAFAARETGAYIVPFSWEADRVWKLGTRDLMMIPKPFAKIVAKFGDPIFIPKENEGNLVKETDLLRDALLGLQFK